MTVKLKSTIDMVALGLILISVYLFLFIVGVTNNITKFLGIAGAIIIIIVEGIFLIQKWRR